MMGAIFMQFPNPTTIPSNRKYDYVSWAGIPLEGYEDRPWELDTGPAMISDSESLVVVLTKYSCRSNAVQKEFDWYPKRKPVFIVPIAGEPVPVEWKNRPNLHVIDPPASLDLNGLLRMAMEQAVEADNDGRTQDAELLYFEAINLQGIVAPNNISRLAHLHGAKGTQEIKLGLGQGAIQTLSACLRLCDLLPDADQLNRLVKLDESSGGILMLGITPASAMRAHALCDLGVAHMVARNETTMEQHEKVEHRRLARECWEKCLAILRADANLLRRMNGFPYDDLQARCEEFLQRSNLPHTD